MDALKEYYEFVFQLDQFLEVILGTELCQKLNLNDAFFDIVCITSEYAIEQFYGQLMIESVQTYEQFINSVEQIVIEKNFSGFQYFFTRELFMQDRFRYLYNLVGEHYFFMMMKSFNFYQMDQYFNCYLRFGKQIVEEDRLSLVERRSIDADQLNQLVNQTFCKSNAKLIGPFMRQEIRPIQPVYLHCMRELDTFYSFQDCINESICEFIKKKADEYEESYLLDPKKSIKLHFYSLDLANQRLERERIYENQNFAETQRQFLNQFDNMNPASLFEKIFELDLEVKQMIGRFRHVKNDLIVLLSKFMHNHKSCNFIDLLNTNCPITKISKNFNPNQPNTTESNLCEYTKQDEVADYMKSVIDCLLSDGLLGDNLKVLERWFNMIPYQNGKVDIYYSNFYYKFDFKEVQWMAEKNIPLSSNLYKFKIRIIYCLITWLSNYILDLLHFSFYIVRGNRIKFYRFDFWAEIIKSQLNEWQKNDQITIYNYEKMKYDELLDLECSIRTCSEYIQIHSLISKNDSTLEEQFKYANAILKTLCNDRVRLFRTETDFYNQLKSFYLKCKANNENIHYFKFEFTNQFSNINQTKLNQIVLENLVDFSRKYQLEAFEIRKAKIYSKVKRLKENELYYVNINGLELLDNLRLSGFYDLENNLINDLNFSQSLNIEFFNNLIFKFLKRHRLKLNNKTYLVMNEGLPVNQYLTNQLLTLYVNHLIETSLPNLHLNSNILLFCEHNKLILFTNNQIDFNESSRSILSCLKDYNLKIRNQNSFSSQKITNLKGLKEKCNFNCFELRLDARKPIEYKTELHNIRNVKSSFSYHLFEKPDEFKKLLNESFLNNFKFFILDESCCTFEEVYYHLFVYFSFHTVQIFHFIFHSILLTKDENPQFIFEFIFDLIYNILQQIKYKETLIPNFKCTITYSELLWLLVKSFKVTWSRFPKRYSELDMIRQIEAWIRPSISERATEFGDEEYSVAFMNLFKNFNPCISMHKMK